MRSEKGVKIVTYSCQKPALFNRITIFRTRHMGNTSADELGEVLFLSHVNHSSSIEFGLECHSTELTFVITLGSECVSFHARNVSPLTSPWFKYSVGRSFELSGSKILTEFICFYDVHLK